MKKIYTLGFIYTLLGGIMWGFSGACAQYIFMNYEITANWLLPMRLFCSGFIMISYLFIKKKKKIFVIFKSKKDTKTLLIYTFFGLILCQYNYFLAVEYSNAAVATVIAYIAPGLVFLYVIYKTKRFPTFKENTALLLASIGIFLIATHGKFDSLAVSKIAFITAILSAFGIAGFTVIPIKINLKYSVFYNLAWGLFISGLFMVLVLRIWNLNGIYDLKGFLALLSIVFFGTIGAFVFYLLGVELIGPSRAAVLSSAEPLSASAFAYFWLGTPLIWIDGLGFAAIIIAMYFLRK